MSDGHLSGLKVIVTRPRSQAAELVGALEAEGGEAVVVPVILITDPIDGGDALRAGLAALRPGDWLIVTSPNGATRVGSVIAGSPLTDGVKVAAIGPGTSRAANKVGLDIDLVPGRSIAEGLLEIFPEPSSGGGLVMLARAEAGRGTLPDGLVAKGWIVDDVAAYRTVAEPVDEVGRAACREADAVLFTSSSTVSRLVEAVGVGCLPPRLVSIGPATSATMRDLGLRVDAEADPHTIPGLIQAVISCFYERSGPLSGPERS